MRYLHFQFLVKVKIIFGLRENVSREISNMGVMTASLPSSYSVVAHHKGLSFL